MPMLEVKDLRTSFFTPAGEVKAVNGVSFNLDHGKVLGIVGESGSGKSVTAYSIMQILEKNGKIVSGSIKMDGQELVDAGEIGDAASLIPNYLRLSQAERERLEKEQRNKGKNKLCGKRIVHVTSDNRI